MDIQLENNKVLNYSVVSTREIIIESYNYLTEDTKSSTGDIESITFDKNYTISLGDKLPHEMVNKVTSETYRRHYTINKITKKGELYTLCEEEELLSNYFLLPSIVTGDIAQYNLGSLMNCYADTTDEKWAGTRGVIYLKYRNDPFTKFIEMDGYFESKSNYINKIVLDGFIVYIFKILTPYIKDVGCYFSNDYYSISEDYSTKIIKYFKLTERSKIYRLLFDRVKYREELENKLGCDIPENLPLFSKPHYPIL